MIKNKKQYRITKNQIKKLDATLNLITVEKPSDSKIDILKKAEKEALFSQLEDLKAEILEYEELCSGGVFISELNSLAELPKTLIKARISKGLTHKELGDLLGIKEQQVQRYEATDYKAANFTRIFEIMKVLDIRHKMDISITSPKIPIKSIFRRLKDVGLDYKFITERIIPFDILSQFEKDLDKNISNSTGSIIQIASILSKVFNWTISDILGKEPLSLDLSNAGYPNFKKRKKSEKKRFDAYVIYAHHLALLLLEATLDLPQKDIPTDPIKVRNEIIKEYGSISFENTLHYVWGLGIPVLPLNDSGAFHGACWRVDGRNIIVLKQKTQAKDRWLFDLLHELWHISQNPEKKQLSIIESSVDDIESFESDEEIEANQFAGDTILDGRAEHITELCVKKANGKIEWLKKSVIDISQKENVPIGSLAYYIAFRLSLQGINWWGAAENLQNIEEHPWEIARNFLLKQRLFDKLNRIDKDLLIQALLG